MMEIEREIEREIESRVVATYYRRHKTKNIIILIPYYNFKATSISSIELILVNCDLYSVQVLDHFYTNYGGVWTGCFRFEKSSACRGALAGTYDRVSVRTSFPLQ